MSSGFKAIKVTDKVWWVGAVDWAVRDFHGYNTARGTTYNAFLVIGDKVTLIDTVKEHFADEMFARIASVIEPERIDYIVSNHSEPDHTGELLRTIDKVKPEKVFASKMGVKALWEHYGLKDVEALGSGDNLDLGGATLAFTETRMLHWPDSMFCYFVEKKLLFSQDAFGMHLASTERFADELDRVVLAEEAAKYYANILMPLSKRVAALLKKTAESGLEIDFIAPDHGPLYRRREDMDWITGRYAEWSERKPGLKAVIVYDTMWRSTEKMARAMADGLAEGGVRSEIFPMNASPRSDVATSLLDAGALLVGSPTLNNNIFPTVADVLTYIEGLKPTKLLGAVFGSYGWSGEAVGQLEEILKRMKVEIVAEPIKIRYVPDANDLERCRLSGTEMAEKLKASLGETKIPK